MDTFIYMDIRNYFWDEFIVLIYSSHLHLLRYTFYFRFIVSYIINDHVINNKPTTNLYFYPIIFIILLFTLVISEVLFTQKLYYTLYIFFILVIVRPIIQSIFAFYSTSLIETLCLADYLTLNWNHIFSLILKPFEKALIIIHNFLKNTSYKLLY
jgi:hypothetical protein